MVFKHYLNEFDAEPTCPKCSNDGPMCFKYCQGEPTKPTPNGDYLEKILQSQITHGEDMYCAIFVIPHLHVICCRCGFMFYSGCADTKPGIVKRVNSYVAVKRQKQSKAEWPEVIV
jgi:hypothetical protein